MSLTQFQFKKLHFSQAENETFRNNDTVTHVFFLIGPY